MSNLLQQSDTPQVEPEEYDPYQQQKQERISKFTIFKDLFDRDVEQIVAETQTQTPEEPKKDNGIDLNRKEIMDLMKLVLPMSLQEQIHFNQNIISQINAEKPIMLTNDT